MQFNKIYLKILLIMIISSCGGFDSSNNSITVDKDHNKDLKLNDQINDDDVEIHTSAVVQMSEYPNIEKRIITEEELKLIDDLKIIYKLEIEKYKNKLTVYINKDIRNFTKDSDIIFEKLLKLSVYVDRLIIEEGVNMTSEDYLKFSQFKYLVSFRDSSGLLNDQNSIIVENMLYLKDIKIESDSISLKTMRILSKKKYLNYLSIVTNLNNPLTLKGLDGCIPLKNLDLSSSTNVDPETLELILSLNLPNLEVVLIPEEHLTNVTLKEAIYYDKLFHKRFPKFNMLTHVEFPEYPESENEE